MADLPDLRNRGIPFLALVDGEGVAVSGTTTVAQFRDRAMRTVCQVDGTGVEVVGVQNIATLRSRAISFFCEVNESGIDPLGSLTLAQLRDKAIPGYCVVDLNGVAQTGSLTIAQLRDRGIASFCPVDENGFSTGLGAARISLVGRTIPENSANGTTVGTLSTVGTTGTAAFTLVDNAGGRFNLVGALLKVANGLLLDYETNQFHTIVVSVTGVTPTIANRTFVISVTDVDDTAPTITSPASFSVPENSVLALALTADEPVTWSLVGGADLAKFQLTGSTLQWLANGTKDFEAPDDANLDNAYIVQIRATDLASNITNLTVTVTVTDVDDTAPTITSASSTSIAENNPLAFALTANETVTWSIVGGADQARFQLSGSTLQWLANGTKDFEAPDDADLNNVYIVQVRATDLASNTTNQTISVTVTDVTEGGGGSATATYFYFTQY